jgi:hypothetical protein
LLIASAAGVIRQFGQAEVLKPTIHSLRRDGEQLAEIADPFAACCPGAVQPALRYEQARGKIVGGIFRLVVADRPGRSK